MINLIHVHNMFNDWRKKGIEYHYPVKNSKGEGKYMLLAKGFLDRYIFLQYDELQKFSSLVMESGHWPGKEETEKLIELILADNMQGLDYSGPYVPSGDENYDNYLQRIGRSLFPRKDEKWISDNALTIRIVYESGYCCAHCKERQGENKHCPYGNRMLGAISKQDGHLEAKRVAGQCDYLQRRDDDKAVQQEAPAAEAEDGEEERQGNDVVYEKAQYACDIFDYASGTYPQEAYQ